MRKNVADLQRQILRHRHNAVAGPCAHGPGEIGDAQIISVQDLTGHVLVCARGRPPLCRLRNVQTELSKLKSAAQGGMFARRAPGALLLDYVPPEEPPSTPLGNALRIR